MIIILDASWRDEIVKFLKDEERDNFRDRYSYGTGKGKLKIDIADWSEESIDALRKFLVSKAETDRSAHMSLTNVEKFQKIKIDPNGTTVSKLEHLKAPMTLYIGASEHRYLFEQTKDGNMVPWFVGSMEYYETNKRSGSPASFKITLVSVNSPGQYKNDFGEDTIRLDSSDIYHKTMSQILAAKGYFLETPALMSQYKKEIDTYLSHCDEDGFQMSVSGQCQVLDGSWSDGSWKAVEQSGRPAKMVIDKTTKERGITSYHSAFWDADEEVLWKIPIHPVFTMFDLGEHVRFRVHVNNAFPYVYDDTVDGKLVLPADVKDFLTVLIEHSKNRFKDIIGGKEGGTIVLIEGYPGIGKTLSAEVFSEKMHRPLYKVQSAQLGVTPEKVESNLKEVLARSERWGAILLIDEADVYVRARGDDINQNAIVGVFLRVLEYYRGVLFMTTNLGNKVDDAIVSRTTARFEFGMPEIEDQKRIWRILSDQNDAGLTDSDISKIVKTMPELSGRDIKNLLKLAVIYSASTGEKINPNAIKFVSRFKQSGKAKVVED